MISFTHRQRSLALFFSASAYIAWFSGLGERLDARSLGAPAPMLTLAPRALPPAVGSVILRDPFAAAPSEDRPEPPPAPRAMNASAAFTSGYTSVPNLAGAPPVPDPGNGTTLVAQQSAPNDVRPASSAMTLVVRATIVGSNPVAYVANGSMMDIVRIGDRLGDRRVAKIDLRGLAFADGSRLELVGSFEAPPAPSRRQVTTGGVTIRLDDLRKLLGVAHAQSPPLAPSTGATVVTPTAAPPKPAGTFPTPGPLPTVNQRGVPVGTNPTFDPTGPTPYPEPYPYAPPARR